MACTAAGATSKDRNLLAALTAAPAAAATKKTRRSSRSWLARCRSPRAPAMLKVLPREEVYRVNIVWTLATGP